MKHAITLGQLAGYGSLADGTLRLKIDVPKEYAREALAALADAIGQQVSVARLIEPGARAGAQQEVEPRPAATVESSASSGASPEPGTNRRWDELPPAQQAGIRCADPEFQRYMGIDPEGDGLHEPEEVAARDVRFACNVASRADLNSNPKAAAMWREIDAAYQAATGRIAEQRA